MNIKILDSWLREYLETPATPEEIGKQLSLTSVGVERIEPYGTTDWTYDIEVTTNRPDLMSVIGLAREAATVLPRAGIEAAFSEKYLKIFKPTAEGIIKDAESIMIEGENLLTLKNNADLVNRMCAVIMEVELGDSPEFMKDRLESGDIRSLNNVIDITNYVMREVGHPAHVFDYDRITTKQLEIRESRKNEKVKTLDGKEYTLPGEDIVGDDGLGHIIDLIGIMGLENSVVTDKTKLILFFIDNNEPAHIRRTSMATGIRTEAAVLNEKGLDPELAMTALLRGIDLYQEHAHGKLLSPVMDIYPNRVETHPITVKLHKVNNVIGVGISLREAEDILVNLGFSVTTDDNTLTVTPPTFRANDVQIEEDVIEEIARIHGYHTLPSVLPPLRQNQTYNRETDPYYWESRAKHALKYWGFDEVYTYSLVSEDLLEGPPEEAVKLKNPLSQDMVYLRKTLIPSLLQVLNENKSREAIQIFEISNVYHKQKRNLPIETQMLAGVLKSPYVSFAVGKGVIESLFADLGIQYEFKPTTQGGEGSDVYIYSNLASHAQNRQEARSKKPEASFIGTIEILDEHTIDFELNFEIIRNAATNKKVYTPVSKFPPVIEDMRFEIAQNISYADIVQVIREQSELIKSVTLLDTYQNKKTFRITYQDPERNLTNEDVTPIREKITHALEQKFHVKIA